ncbi:PH domain-containing protein [Nocardia sp. CA-290969]|uniref:PH domain-containing protein n=1 Tax=Nocardia sp. CA-290969 TaxID=3239986 RepID=UPI003D8B9440
MIRTTRLAFLGVVILALCVFFPIVGWPAGLFWLALIPIAVIVWILRTQTTVSPTGLDLRSLLSSRHIDWAQIKGLSIPKRGYVRAHLDDDTEVPLPAVSYDRLRDLVDAAEGRIPDPFVLPDLDEADSDEPGTEAGSADDEAVAEGSTAEPSGSAGSTAEQSSSAGAADEEPGSAGRDAAKPGGEKSADER